MGVIITIRPLIIPRFFLIPMGVFSHVRKDFRNFEFKPLLTIIRDFEFALPLVG